MNSMNIQPTDSSRYPPRIRNPVPQKNQEAANQIAALTEQRAMAQQKRNDIKQMLKQNLQTTPMYNSLITNQYDFDVMMEELSRMRLNGGKRRRTNRRRTNRRRTNRRNR